MVVASAFGCVWFGLLLRGHGASQASFPPCFSFVALGVISVLVLVGFSLCFGDSLGGIVGNP